METEINFSGSLRIEKLRKRKLGFGVFALIFFLLTIIFCNVDFVGRLIVLYVTLSVCVICFNAFMILRNKYNKSQASKEEAVVEAEKALPKHERILIWLVIINIIAIVMICLSVPDFEIICEGMFCEIPLSIFIILLIISGSLTIIKTVQYVDSRKLIKLNLEK